MVGKFEPIKKIKTADSNVVELVNDMTKALSKWNELSNVYY